MDNINVRVGVAIYESRFSKGEIADEIGIKRDTFYHWFLKDLTPIQENVILNAIQRLKEKR